MPKPCYQEQNPIKSAPVTSPCPEVLVVMKCHLQRYGEAQLQYDTHPNSYQPGVICQSGPEICNKSHLIYTCQLDAGAAARLRQLGHNSAAGSDG